MLLAERDDILVRPVDKRENFIKRCVAVAGDTISIVDGVVYIDGKRSDAPEMSLSPWLVTMEGNASIPADFLTEEMDIDPDDPEQRDFGSVPGMPGTFRMNHPFRDPLSVEVGHFLMKNIISMFCMLSTLFIIIFFRSFSRINQQV
jgi:hypothetical protein